MQNLDDDDWNDLQLLYISVKQEKTEKGDVNNIEANFDWQSIEDLSLMVGYSDIFPYGKQITFKFNSEECLVDDAYCLRHGCNCSNINLNFFKMADLEKKDKVDFQSIMFNYKTREYYFENVTESDEVLQSLVNEFFKSKPGILNLLNKRRKKLKTLYENYLKREGIELKNEEANKPERVGRNDPCPCGSGKKYKKCCLNNS